MANLRFIITGGPGAGKTTTLEALAERGYYYVPEVARAIIKQRLEAGLSPRPPLAQFAQDILRMDMTYYRQTPVKDKDKPIFFDRGVVDALAFVDEQNAISPAQVAAHIQAYPYNKVVFLMPPWEQIYATDTERDQTFPESVQVFESLRSWYAQWDYRTVEVPRGDVDRRVAFILKTVRHRMNSTPDTKNVLETR